ncbi:MAG: cyclic pyranopterin monophosphate synthase MoaC [Chloroflexi bacterium]|nr:cyclic pyranopterin monophosphate synthase MoaC [Chloroflexota bacterium]
MLIVKGLAEMIDIYTDGSCIVNPGPGGWAAIVFDGESKRVLSGGDQKTTNNRMEILAVVKGLQTVPEASEVTVYSDSQYVINTMTRNWKRNANQDLWEQLDAEVNKRAVKWQWVRGHSGHPLNEEVDKLANGEARKIKKALGGGAGLTHVDEAGKAAMVDVGWKSETERVAVAKGSISMMPETLELIRANGFEKGDVLGVARIAGIMGAKNTSQLIPLCHPLPLDQVTVEFEYEDERGAVSITATAKTTARTGVEMEALTAVSVAALTIYDMCKGVDRAMRIGDIRLIRKTGGKSGDIFLEE